MAILRREADGRFVVETQSAEEERALAWSINDPVALPRPLPHHQRFGVAERNEARFVVTASSRFMGGVSIGEFARCDRRDDAELIARLLQEDADRRGVGADNATC